MMSIPADAPGKNGSARQIMKHAALDLEGTHAETNARSMRVRVIADAQTDLPEMREHDLVENDSLRGRDLYGSGHLRPVVAFRFELAAPPTTAQYCVGRPRGRYPLQKCPALLVGIPVIGRRAHPARIGKTNPPEREIAQRAFIRATHSEQVLQARQLDTHLLDCSAVFWPQVNLACLGVDIELPWLCQKRE